MPGMSCPLNDINGYKCRIHSKEIKPQLSRFKQPLNCSLLLQQKLFESFLAQSIESIRLPVPPSGDQTRLQGSQSN